MTPGSVPRRVRWCDPKNACVGQGWRKASTRGCRTNGRLPSNSERVREASEALVCVELNGGMGRDMAGPCRPNSIKIEVHAPSRR